LFCGVYKKEWNVPVKGSALSFSRHFGYFGKELLRTNAKYYAVDIGLRYYLLGGAPNKDAGHILENIVYLELLRRGYKVEIGRIKTTKK
jgi:predicted AAA+ superfamily ATPase